jgi:hypothetical protein
MPPETSYNIETIKAGSGKTADIYKCTPIHQAPIKKTQASINAAPKRLTAMKST